MLRLETRTSSWTYWRRPTHQNTGLSEFIRYIDMKMCTTAYKVFSAELHSASLFFVHKILTRYFLDAS